MKTNAKLQIACLVLMYCLKVSAQCSTTHPSQCPNFSGCQHTPLHYFTFDYDTLPFRDCKDSATTIGAFYAIQLLQDSSSRKVGKYQKIIPAASAIQEASNNNFFTNEDSISSKAYTFEFLFRINSDSLYEFDFVLRFYTLFRLTRSHIFFQASYKTPAGVSTYNQCYSDLNKSGRLASNYFRDKKWHHIVCRFDGNGGSMQLWIDGGLLSALNTNVPAGSMPYEPALGPPWSSKPNVYISGLQDSTSTVDLDEIAFYNEALSADLLYQHFLNTQNGEHYDCNEDTTIIIPTPPAPGDCPNYASCTYQPLRYFNFDNNCTPLKDCMDADSIKSTTGYLTSLTSSPRVGKYAQMSITGTSNLVGFSDNFFPNGDSISSKEFTFEFLCRINSSSFNEIDFRLRGATLFRLLPTNLFFQVQFKNPSFTYNSAGWGFTGTGILASNYFTDKQWHHIVCNFDGNSGFMEIWIDGQRATQLSTTINTGSMPYEPSSSNDFPSIYVNGLDNNGTLDVDEVAFYDKALPSGLIYQHFLNSQHGEHYDCAVDPAVSAPSAYDYMSGTYDTLDFVPHHPLDGSGMPLTTYDLGGSVAPVIDQLQDYPLPRLKKGHALNPNINWMDNTYLGRLSHVSNVSNDIAIQEQLASKWNYMFNINPNAAVGGDPTYQSNINSFANTHSQYKYSILNNVNFVTAPKIYDTCYVSSTCPAILGYLAPDSNTVRYYDTLGYRALTNIVNKVINVTDTLKRAISYVSENGPENPYFTLYDSGCPYNDGVQAPLNLFTNTFLSTPDPGANAWQSYYGKCSSIFESHYKNQILGGHAMIPSTAKYSRYLVSSVYERQYFEDYFRSRDINTPFVHGSNTNYYSTPPFYIERPYYWKTPIGLGTEWGWVQIVENPYGVTGGGRIREISLGDSLFAPFVAAGWSSETNNLRPGQWLGLLKGLGVLGADYYHISYFNVTKTVHIGSHSYQYFPTDTVFPVDPKGWCYQAVMPVYAQGISSRFEKFLHASNVYQTVKNMALFVARQYSYDTNKFLLYGSLQQNSNLVGNTPYSETYELKDSLSGVLNGMKFEVRRQGSTYFYDAGSHVFYQLDKWHERTHPSYWNKDFEIEAELNDFSDFNNASGANNLVDHSMSLKTQVPSGTAAGDYRNYTTYVEYAASGAPTKSYYYFEPRVTSGGKYFLWVRARATSAAPGGQSKINFKVAAITGGSPVLEKTIPCIDSSSTLFKWYYLTVPKDSVGAIPAHDSISVSPNHEYEISFTGNAYVEFDKFILSESNGVPSGVDSNEISLPCLASNRTFQQTKNEILGLNIYPNPSPGNFNIRIKDHSKEILEMITIYNSQGQISQQYSLSDKQIREMELNLNQANGIYLIKIKTDKSMYQQKIILAK